LPRLALLVVLSLLQGECHSEELARMSCAQGAVLALLTAYDVPVEADAVLAAFPAEHRPSDSATPMNIVCDVLQTFGLQAQAVKFDVNGARDRWERSILLLDAAPDDAGHFVLLKAITDRDEVVLVDPRHSASEHVLTLDQLSAYWKGHAIVVRESRSLSWYLTPVLVGAIAVLLLDRWRNGATTRHLSKADAAPLIVTLLCLTGCSQAKSADPAEITFVERQMQIHDLVEGQSTVIAIPFMVHAAGVSIAEIKSSCSCATILTDFAGKPLTAGTRYEIKVQIDPKDKQEIGVDVVVTTQSGKAARVNLAGIVTGIPRTPMPIVLSEFISGLNIRMSGEVVIERTKPVDTPQMSIPVGSFVGKAVTLTHKGTSVTRLRRSRAGGGVFLERSQWAWEAIADEHGKFAREIVDIRLDDYSIPIEFRFIETPPLNGLTQSVFVGRLPPRAPWSKTFQVETLPDRYVTGTMATAGCDIQTGSVLENGDQNVTISISTPGETGKFRHTVQLTLHGIEHPYEMELFGEVVATRE